MQDNFNDNHFEEYKNVNSLHNNKKSGLKNNQLARWASIPNKHVFLYVYCLF